MSTLEIILIGVALAALVLAAAALWAVAMLFGIIEAIYRGFK